MIKKKYTLLHCIRTNLEITYWVCVKKAHRSSENWGKQPIVQHSWGIDTDKIEENSSCETEYNGWCSTDRVDGNPLMSGEETGGGNRDILLQSKANVELRANGPETRWILIVVCGQSGWHTYQSDSHQSEMINPPWAIISWHFRSHNNNKLLHKVLCQSLHFMHAETWEQVQYNALTSPSMKIITMAARINMLVPALKNL